MGFRVNPPLLLKVLVVGYVIRFGDYSIIVSGGRGVAVGEEMSVRESQHDGSGLYKLP